MAESLAVKPGLLGDFGMEASYIACKHLALCLNEDAYKVCRTIPCRLFREKLQVLIPLCFLGVVGVGAIWKAHKRTVLRSVALVLIYQHGEGLSCSHQSVLSSFAEA